MLPSIKTESQRYLFVPEKIPDDFDAMQGAYRRNFALLFAGDCEAVKRGDVVGRYFREAVEDGYAYYVVSEDLADGWVRIQLAHGVGTDTPVAYYGEEAAILKGLALSRIQHRYS